MSYTIVKEVECPACGWAWRVPQEQIDIECSCGKVFQDFTEATVTDQSWYEVQEESINNRTFSDDPTPDYYRYMYKGLKIDPYRIMVLYDITHPAHQQALKKILRAGRGDRNLEDDILGVMSALERWLEMIREEG